jgi:hypothetical protein
VCRAVWRRLKPGYTWVITNKVLFNDNDSGVNYNDRFVTKANIPMHCSIVKAKGDQNYETIVDYSKRIA